MPLIYQVKVNPAPNKELSIARKAWCREHVGEPGKDWVCTWSVTDILANNPTDIFRFAKEEHATWFLLRWA